MDMRHFEHLAPAESSPLSRVTRSSARLNLATPSTSSTDAVTPPAPPSTRKRKVASADTSPTTAGASTQPRKRTKRARADAVEPPPPPPEPPKIRKRGSRVSAAMSGAGTAPGLSEEHGPSQTTPAPARSTTPPVKQRKHRGKKGIFEQDPSFPTARQPKKSAKSSRNQKSKAGADQAEPAMDKDNDDDDEDDDSQSSSDGENAEKNPGGSYDMGDGSVFGRQWSAAPEHAALQSAMRNIHGQITRTMQELRVILENLRQKDDPTLQRAALEELAQVLLMANEDTLAGHFAPDPYIKELIPLMQPDENGDENPEMMLIACRCIANMMEALPACAQNVVYGGAVPILCQKLLEIHYIDLAEQAISTLEKISAEFPASIVREGGLTACLTYLDFFATSTQRTAVTTAANCCRNIPEDSFATVRDVMPILLQVLGSSDQKVLEQGCLCVSRIVESFKFHDNKLEELVSEDLLKAVLRLLLPGTTSLVGPKIHTLFLRVLAITARSSPKRSVSLIKMNVVDTLFQILTGVSPPSGDGDMSNKIDKVMVMQSLIHRPRDQISETLNVICELLPNVTVDGMHYLDGLMNHSHHGHDGNPLSRSSRVHTENRSKLLEGCKEELRRFIVILMPTLTDAYSSTVNYSVRQRVLTAQLKMLSNIDVDILEDALRNVSYSSFLASILSQGDHPLLVTLALQAAETLLRRMDNIYRYQFYREGVIAEINALASKCGNAAEPKPESKGAAESIEVVPTSSDGGQAIIGDLEMEFNDGDEGDMDEDDEDDHEIGDDENDEDEDDENDENEENHDVDPEDDHQYDHSPSEESDSGSDEEHVPLPVPSVSNPDDMITSCAKRFIAVYDNAESADMRAQAEQTRIDLQKLTQEITTCYAENAGQGDYQLFRKLSLYFSQDSLASVTSYELLSSRIVDALLDQFSEQNPKYAEARATFLQAFMIPDVPAQHVEGNQPATPFGVFVHKLQDLLSRSEHFEVRTVQHGTYDNGRGSPANMLAKQVRIRLVAEENSGITNFRETMVTVHALATIKSLGDFLRPRLSLPVPERGGRSHRDSPFRREFPSALAAYAAAIHRRDPASFPPIPTPSDLTNRIIPKRSGSSKNAASTDVANPGASALDAQSLRRSRRHAQPVPPPAPPAKEEGETLECADEKQVSSDEDMDEEAALNAIVDRLEEEMDDEEPSAVNLEVAATGKVTARKDDGTRVSTPGATPTSTSAGTRAVSSPRTHGTPHRHMNLARSLSYAAAMASTPQDWHIEFTINGQPITQDSTVYRVVHFSQVQPNDVSARSLLSSTHTIKFKKVPGPPPAEPTTVTQLTQFTQPTESGLPASLTGSPTTATILRLLSLLHGLNSNLEDVVVENKDSEKLVAEPLSQFVNTKLTAKLNRQLEEPLIVASGCLPTWSEDLARLYPFLFPFETRHLFLQSTSFGFARSMTRWQHEQSTNDSRSDRLRDERQYLGRLQRQKVRISRGKILESAIKVMDLYGASPAILEVEFFDEVGTGLGPTLEFYSTVSREFAKKKLKLWRENESDDKSEYAFGAHGLFPAPMSQEFANSENGKKLLVLFKILGKFVARSMLDSRIIDISFNPTLFRIGNSVTAVTPSLGAVEFVDKSLAQSLRQLKRAVMQKKVIQEDESLSAAERTQHINDIKVSDVPVGSLALDFTLPGYDDIELVPNGSQTAVTIWNLDDYIAKVMDFTLGKGVYRQVEAFQAGFSQVFPYAAIHAFTPDELVMLYGRVDEDWSLETLIDSIKADHGYNLDSKSVQNLLQIMSSLMPQERRDFLQFVTGSPKLPIGGFKSLTPMFTVVCKPSEPPYSSDDYLPSVMTCVNYLKLPDYTSLETMRKKMDIAIKEGQGAFHLS